MILASRATRWHVACQACSAPVDPGRGLVAGRALCLPCAVVGEVPEPDPWPAGSEGLRPYQRIGARALAGSHALLLADEPGIGKTAQAIVAGVLLGCPPMVVVCPPHLREQWAREVGRWSGGAYRARVIQPGSIWVEPGPGEAAVLGYAWLRGKTDADWTVGAGTVLVLDEAQWVKNPEAKQTRGTRALSRAVAAAGGRAWALTATPVLGREDEPWQVLVSAALAPWLAPSHAAYELLTAGERRRRLEDVMLRRRARDVAKDLPQVVYQRIDVVLDAAATAAVDHAAALEAAKAQHRFEHGLFAELDEGQVAALAAELEQGQAYREVLQRLEEEEVTLQTLSGLRRALAVAKIPRALVIAQEHQDAGVPLLVTSCHRDPVEALGACSGWGKILGGVAAKERARVIAEFQAGKLCGVAATIQAVGTGTDGLQRVCSRMLRVDRDWTVAVNDLQGVGRLARMGACADTVFVTDLFTDHPAEALVDAVLARKGRLLEDYGMGVS